MRSLIRLTFLAAALAAAPAAAQKLGARTATPDQVLSQLGSGLTDEAIARDVAAAEAHPLGTLANPVRVGGPAGERAYLARLRCADGSAPAIGPSTAAGIGAFGSLANRYRLDCGPRAPGAVDVVFDMYHDGHVETRAPAGLTLAAG
ncbi:MAG: hypothetical protein ACK4K7_14625 [Allosphingosinicella sp.]|uniref:hypothetical protein n=1 Tax=Allosphingosinicella sp. TaxID=2823234 RepID=UPI00395AAC50